MHQNCTKTSPKLCQNHTIAPLKLHQRHQWFMPSGAQAGSVWGRGFCLAPPALPSSFCCWATGLNISSQADQTDRASALMFQPFCPPSPAWTMAPGHPGSGDNGRSSGGTWGSDTGPSLVCSVRGFLRATGITVASWMCVRPFLPFLRDRGTDPWHAVSLVLSAVSDQHQRTPCTPGSVLAHPTCPHGSLCEPPIPLWNKHSPSAPIPVHEGICCRGEVRDLPLELMGTPSLKTLLLLSPEAGRAFKSGKWCGVS